MARSQKARVVGKGQVDPDRQVSGVVCDHPDFPGWRFTLSVLPSGEVSSLSITPDAWPVRITEPDGVIEIDPYPPEATPAGGITKRNLLRELPLEALRRVVRAEASASLRAALGFASPDLHRALEREARHYDWSDRPGRGGGDPYQSAVLAAAYIDRRRRGEAPRAIATALGFADVKQLHNRLATARDHHVCRSIGRGELELTELGSRLISERGTHGTRRGQA